MLTFRDPSIQPPDVESVIEIHPRQTATSFPGLPKFRLRGARQTAKVRGAGSRTHRILPGSAPGTDRTLQALGVTFRAPGVWVVEPSPSERRGRWASRHDWQSLPGVLVIRGSERGQEDPRGPESGGERVGWEGRAAGPALSGGIWGLAWPPLEASRPSGCTGRPGSQRFPRRPRFKEGPSSLPDSIPTKEGLPHCQGRP